MNEGKFDQIVTQNRFSILNNSTCSMSDCFSDDGSPDPDIGGRFWSLDDSIDSTESRESDREFYQEFLRTPDPKRPTKVTIKAYSAPNAPDSVTVKTPERTPPTMMIAVIRPGIALANVIASAVQPGNFSAT